MARGFEFWRYFETRPLAGNYAEKDEDHPLWIFWNLKWPETITDHQFEELAVRRSKCRVMVYGLEYGLIACRDYSIIAAVQCAVRGLLTITLPMQFLVIYR